MLQELGITQGYLKSACLGFPKSGKSYTAALLLCGLHKYMKCKKPIVMFDTESGSQFLAPIVKHLTGMPLLGVKARAFSDLVKLRNEVTEQGTEILLIDSMTHPWDEIQEGYLESKNEGREQSKRRDYLSFEDWRPIKRKWNKDWTDWFLNSSIHIHICARAGNIYEFKRDEETGKKELEVVGVKMRVETQFGFEPNLIFEMKLIEEPGKPSVHRCTVLGDRSSAMSTLIGDAKGILTGRVCDDPTFDFFLPHIQRLNPAAHAPVDTATKTEFPKTGDAEWFEEQRQRTVLSEEISGALQVLFPGSTNEDKAGRAAMCQELFGTWSKTKIEKETRSDILRTGLATIREKIRAKKEGKA